MSSPNIRDLLTSFSPSSDFFAITSGDGRIKIWDTLKGQLQTQLPDFAASGDSGLLSEAKSGHLALDYTCMKWVQLQSKKKRKGGGSLLVLGTGGGDVLALDVSTGQSRWKINDCHPGEEMPSQAHFERNSNQKPIDISTGKVLGRFRSSTKAISSLCVFSDGKILATAAGQLKTFNCSNQKKIQKFSGHPVSVRCMIFSEDAQYILSSGVSEKYIAIWKVGAVKKMGICYFWYGSSIDDLRNKKPTKIMLSESSLAKGNHGFAILAAKIQETGKPASGQVLVACGSVVKPSFQKLLVQYGTDIKLEVSQVGTLLPVSHSAIPRKGQAMQNQVTALDRANAEDAILPLPKLYTYDKKRKHRVTELTADTEITMADHSYDKSLPVDKSATVQRMEEDTVCIEDRMRELGLLSTSSYLEKYHDSTTSLDDDTPAKKIRAHLLSMSHDDAYKFLETLVSAWRTRSNSAKQILPWIYWLLAIHGRFISSQELSSQILDSLRKVHLELNAFSNADAHGYDFSKLCSYRELRKLSGRLQLITAQIDKAGSNAIIPPLGDMKPKEGEDEEDDEEDEEIDEIVYRKKMMHPKVEAMMLKSLCSHR
uniref:Small-subunit processome Utp12 domain-containing protein n=1 Tax=Ananas comosus var. bracteatus TaxID=296719 RepID=A0A6V7QV17_ANACO